MPSYELIVFIISSLVHFLLYVGVTQLFESNSSIFRQLIAGLLSGVYSTLCLIPQFQHLGNPAIRFGWLLLSAIVAFGFMELPFQQVIVYLSLCYIIDLISQSKEMNIRALLLVSMLGLTIYLVGSSHAFPNQKYIPVELTYGKVKLHLTALRDTGNMLRDPLTGKPVLVVDAETAQMITGLTAGQLRAPLETIGAIPGLRLIPYKVIGGGGFLLAMTIPGVKIGTRQGSGVVAFAPDLLHGTRQYQALTGGML